MLYDTLNCMPSPTFAPSFVCNPSSCTNTKLSMSAKRRLKDGFAQCYNLVRYIITRHELQEREIKLSSCVLVFHSNGRCPNMMITNTRLAQHDSGKILRVKWSSLVYGGIVMSTFSPTSNSLSIFFTV